MDKGYAEYEQDWGVAACGYPEDYGAAQWLPILKGTNRKLHKEYRAGSLHDIREPYDGALLVLARLYTLSHEHKSDHAYKAYPKVWGVSCYRPAPDTVYLECMREVDTPLEGSTDPNWKCPEGYVEFKHHFWSEVEARAFYQAIKNRTSSGGYNE